MHDCGCDQELTLWTGQDRTQTDGDKPEWEKDHYRKRGVFLFLVLRSIQEVPKKEDSGIF